MRLRQYLMDAFGSRLIHFQEEQSENQDIYATYKLSGGIECEAKLVFSDEVASIWWREKGSNDWNLAEYLTGQ